MSRERSDPPYSLRAARTCQGLYGDSMTRDFSERSTTVRRLASHFVRGHFVRIDAGSLACRLAPILSPKLNTIEHYQT